MNISYINIGKNIKAARKAMHLTQEQAAERIGITPLHFGRLERVVRRTSLDLLARIADCLNTTLPALLNGVQPTSPYFTQLTQEHIDFGKNLAYLTANVSPEMRSTILAICQDIVKLES